MDEDNEPQVVYRVAPHGSESGIASGLKFEAEVEFFTSDDSTTFGTIKATDFA